MQGLQAVFLVFLAFLIGVNCVNLKNSASSENETKPGTNDICAQYCGRDPSIMCGGDLTTPENMTCGCKDATEAYDEKTNQCLDWCTVKCGTYYSVTCGGDQSSDETTTCGCTDKREVFSNGICISRCTAKCGLAQCTGEQTSDDTTICNCYPNYFHDEVSGECKSRCEVKCGFGPYTTCEGDRKSNETTICGCSLEKLIFDEKSKRCIKRCTKKCGWDSNIKCEGDQRTDETTICGCRDLNRVYDEEKKSCKVKCDCKNGSCETNENGITICKCLPEYGLVSDLRCEECGCGKGANCTFESSSQRKKCICREGYSDVNGICKGDCSHTPCKHGGTCRIVDDNMICDCIPPFTGEYCEEDRCIQKCGRDLGVVCMATKESITCSCRDETKTYDEKSQQCVDRCIQKCGKDPSIICMGDLTSDENITCSCREEDEIYDERSYQCLDRCTVKCGTNAGVACQGNQSSDETTICSCTKNIYVFAHQSCFERCQIKCGVAWCTGDQTSDNTTICNCYSGHFYDEKSGKCEDRCEVKCGNSPYVRCKGDRNSDKTTICGCGSSNLIFDEKNKTCIKRCINKCGWDSNIKCGGDQKTDETTICGCRNSSLVYVQEIQTCKTKCSCVNGICYKDENNTAICNCLPEYGHVSSLRCRACNCGKGANCTFESSSQRKKCICREGYSEVKGICKAKDPCVPNPCQHDGQCENNNGKAKCNCIKGYTGELCETVDPCAPNPCKNGGLCISQKDTYKCVCEKNNPNKDCSEVLWCTLHGWGVCGSYATCHYNEVTGKHSCICPSNRVFDEKSKICKDVCLPNPCAHGTCIRRMGKFVCKCSGSYRGVFCNETITDPCYPNPCQSGGSCTANGLKFTCVCKSPYSGSTCEHGDKTVMKILLVALGIGVLIFVSCGVFCWKRNQKLKKMSRSTGVYHVPPAVMLPDYPGNNINRSAN